ncbi:MAG: ImmA/IrrE family metallo-endopeptidase [Planctomycetaceae bacterium]|jgi:Zn-dependent peptidase ImmA (M78 family)|nr:ImmA/IrrE family metallo-endopeptidase [Planctomycetaceae bacterium]
MSLSSPNFDKTKNRVREVLEENFILDPPVIAQKLAEGYGLTVRYSFFKPEYNDISGFIEADKKRIVVNAEDSPARQNFTIAHELGHYLLEHDLLGSEYTCLFRNPAKQKSTPIEQEANCFAANLLVPSFFLRKYLDDYPFAADEQLSKIFGVSAEVIRFRKQYL